MPGNGPESLADAWYAPDVHDQFEILPGVVATVRGREKASGYDVRERTI